MARLIPIIGAAVVALLIGAGAAWFLKPTPAAAPEAAAPAVEEHKEAYTFSFPVRDKVVNLADPGAKRYLKVSVALEVQDKLAAKRKVAPTPEEQKKFVEEFGGEFAAKVQDVLTNVLSSKKADDVATIDGKERLREELKARINVFLPKDEQLTKIYFTDFVIQ